MKTIDTHGAFKDAIAESNPEARRIARALRQLVHDVCPNATEVPWQRTEFVATLLQLKVDREEVEAGRERCAALLNDI